VHSDFNAPPREINEQEELIQQLQDAILEKQSSIAARGVPGRSGLPPARMLPPSRHPSDKAQPQEEKRRRG